MIKIDKKELVEKFEDKQREIKEGYLTDYLGCFTDISHHSQLKGRIKEILGFPFPNDGMIHPFIEYVGACYAVDIASDTFNVVELGAGTGIWSVRSSLMAKRKGCEISALCVEADQKKIPWIYSNFEVNNLEIDLKVENKAVTVDGKDIKFPVIEDPSWDYGARISKVKNDVDYRGFKLNYSDIKSLSFKEILNSYLKIDFLHVDIQGLEADILPTEIKLLKKKVNVLVLGTHSRKIEGDMFDLFYNNGWELLDEQPCVFEYDTNVPTLDGMVRTDGTQIWVNPSCV